MGYRETPGLAPIDCTRATYVSMGVWVRGTGAPSGNGNSSGCARIACYMLVTYLRLYAQYICPTPMPPSSGGVPSM